MGLHVFHNIAFDGRLWHSITTGKVISITISLTKIQYENREIRSILRFFLAAKIFNDPNVLQTQLHQCIWQHEAALTEQTHATLKTPSTYYNEENNNEDGDSLVDIHYNKQGQPYFKRGIIRSFSSSSNLTTAAAQPVTEIRTISTTIYNITHPSNHIPKSPFSQITKKKLKDSSRNVLTGSVCSWFHLCCQCPEGKHSHSHVNFSEYQIENSGKVDRASNDQHQYEFGRPLENFNYHAPMDPGEKYHGEHPFPSLSHHSHHEIEIADLQTLKYAHASKPPHLHAVPKRYHHLHPNLNV